MVLIYIYMYIYHVSLLDGTHSYLQPRQTLLRMEEDEASGKVESALKKISMKFYEMEVLMVYRCLQSFW